MKKNLVALVIFCLTTSLCAEKQISFIAVPVASAWTHSNIQPKKYQLPLTDKDIPQHSSQLLYGEKVQILEEQKGTGWCKVRALEQPQVNYATRKWGFCDFWMLKKELTHNLSKKYAHNGIVTTLWVQAYDQQEDDNITEQKPALYNFSFGTQLPIVRLEGEWATIALLDGKKAKIQKSDLFIFNRKKQLSEGEQRKQIISYALKFLGGPYCWGGRSAYNKKITSIPTGIDCSGFVNIVYRASGVKVPRNSFAQFIKSRPVEPQKMQPGDLLFFKRQKYNFERVNHVLIYLGGEDFIEAAESSKNVRKVTAEERFGKPLYELYNGIRVFGEAETGGDIEIHCGSLLSDPKLTKSMKLECR